LGIGERLQSIRSLSSCQSKPACKRNAVIQIECRDSIGHPFWNRDFCEAHAKPILEKAERLKIPVSCPDYRTPLSCPVTLANSTSVGDRLGPAAPKAGTRLSR
jgi:hypothetical protein